MGKQKMKSLKKEALRILQEYTKESTIAGLHYAFDRNQGTKFSFHFKLYLYDSISYKRGSCDVFFNTISGNNKQSTDGSMGIMA